VVEESAASRMKRRLGTTFQYHSADSGGGFNRYTYVKIGNTSAAYRDEVQFLSSSMSMVLNRRRSSSAHGHQLRQGKLTRQKARGNRYVHEASKRRSFIVKIILFIAITLMWVNSVHAIAPEFTSYKIEITDPLFEDWTDEYSQMGSTAIYDLEAKISEIEDICGTIEDPPYGRAYHQHHGWDRNLPNDIGGQYTVFAVAPGTIEKVVDGCEKGDKKCGGKMGNAVFIRHNDKVVSKYFHLKNNTMFVKEGQWVDRFHPLAYGGGTGSAW
jgi:hypothetical protein